MKVRPIHTNNFQFFTANDKNLGINVVQLKYKTYTCRINRMNEHCRFTL